MLTTWAVLPGMRERKSGVIVNIASRAATVDFPFSTGYNSSKCAVTRATSTLQEELDLDELDVQMYALHPGGVPTAMSSRESPLSREKKFVADDTVGETNPEILKKYPSLQEATPDFKNLFKDPPELCGAVATYLAAGQAKELRGMYIDCRQDLERIQAVGREKLQKDFLYTLKIDFLEGYKNEP